MDDNRITRRRLLSGVATTGAVGAGGCVGGIFGGSGGCSAASNFARLWLTEEFEKAAGYLPYEHTPDQTKSSSVRALKGLYALASEPEFRGVSCECSESVDAADYRQAKGVSEDLALSKVRIVRLAVTVYNDGREQTETWHVAVYRVEGEGPYVTPGLGGDAERALESLTSDC